MSENQTKQPPQDTPIAAVKSQNKQKMEALDKKRRFNDWFINKAIVVGGIVVLAAVLLIFGYLLRMSYPLFAPTSIEKEHVYAQQKGALHQSYLALDEHGQVGITYAANTFKVFNVKNGETIATLPIPVPKGANIVRVKTGAVLQGYVGLGLSTGELLVVKPKFDAIGIDADRKVTVSMQYPFSQTPLKVSPSPLNNFAFNVNEGTGVQVVSQNGSTVNFKDFGLPSAVAAATEIDGEVSAETADPVSGGLSMADIGEADIQADINLNEIASQTLTTSTPDILDLQIAQAGKVVYVINSNGVIDVVLKGESNFETIDAINAATNGKVTASIMLQGENSLMLGSEKGEISQWFMVKSKDETKPAKLTKIRSFGLEGNPITVLAAESRRRGILAGDSKGYLGYFYTTSERKIAIEKAADTPITAIATSFHNDGMLVESQTETSFWEVDASYPDVSLSSLWGKVWYEGYDKPDYVWQSSAANTDNESKMSLMPLTFGTLKAAFWAMLLAAPIAVAAAMYTATFMSPSLRSKVKPAIELMGALPTVILGFLAGLWLAPLVSTHLPAIFSLIIIVPLVILICGFIWVQIPLEKRNSLPDGITPVILILPLVVAIALAMVLSQPLEHAIFSNYDGSIVKWLESVGIKYENQNALIIGLIMGFAVIPSIFSISEDALFAVPKHLVNGSLALGATAWQTLVRVVLPTASPGIFSGIMVGFGRAVGETMIVVMAAGATPIMSLSLFDGMRTLSANLAIEMGEAEMYSSHFHILFLSALVLFIITFALNTAAEVVRSRLRKKYGSL